MERIARRCLPDGSIRYVHPFHVSMEGKKDAILFRDDKDYDAIVKIICVCAKRKNVIVVVYAVVSNHCHVAVLAASQAVADSYGEEIKRMASMWLNQRYGTTGIMRRVDVKALYLYNDWYARNALAYIPRNALDNGYNVVDYPWSGFRAMFSGRNTTVEGMNRPVSELTKNEKRRLMHTADKLDDVHWLLDGNGCLIPETVCDTEYLEQAFEHDQAYFLKTIGGQNSSEMKYKLIDSPRKMQPDGEFLKIAEESVNRWFGCGIDTLSLERKTRIIPYLNRTVKTSVPQLARVFGLDRAKVSEILGRDCHH